MARRSGGRSLVRPGGYRTQRYPASAPEDRGETTDRLEARRESQSDWLDSCDQADAAIHDDDEALPQRRRLRTHGDLVYEVALSVEIARKLEGRAGLLRRSHPSVWVADSRLFGFKDPLPDRRRRALETDGALRTHQLQDALRDLPVSGGGAFAAAVAAACDRRDLRDIGGLTVAQAEVAGRVRYGPPLHVVFCASRTDPVLLSAAAAVSRRCSGSARLADQLDRAAQAVALEHVDRSVRDPQRGATAERRWEAARDGLDLAALDPAGANFEAWFARTRSVAQVHYAVGLDPVSEPLPTEAVEAVLAAGGSLKAGVQAVGGRGERCHEVARAVQAAFGVVRRLDEWMVADEAALAGVMGPVLERAGLRWPPPDRARVVGRWGLDPGGEAVRPSGPVAAPPPPVADLYLSGRPFAGALWPAGGADCRPLLAAEALAVQAWRTTAPAGVRADVMLDEAEAVHRGGRVGPGAAGVVVAGGRGEPNRPLFPADGVGLAGVRRADSGVASVDQLVAGLGVSVAVQDAAAGCYQRDGDRVVLPADCSDGSYASAVALAAVAATGHATREGRRDAGAPRGSVGWVREQLRCDLAAAKVVGALGLRYEPPPGLGLPAEAREVFVRHGADLCRDADRMASFVLARAKGVELADGYRAGWEALPAEDGPRPAGPSERAREVPLPRG